jgi:hypothetical protein
VTLPLRTDLVCTGTYGTYYVPDRTVCAGGEGLSPFGDNPDTCQGDSGGPLALDTGPRLELVGITSYGDECGLAATPGAYAEPSDDEIGDLLAGRSTATLKGSAGVPPAAPAPPATTPVSETVPPPPPVASFRDTVRPLARLSSLSCTKRRRCSFRVRASDNGGRVSKLSAKVTRRVDGRTLRRTLRTRRIRGGFAAAATFKKGTYKLTFVATDPAGNRSRIGTRRFRVR